MLLCDCLLDQHYVTKCRISVTLIHILIKSERSVLK